MDIIELRDFVLSLPYVKESMPFDDTVVAYTVEGKMFVVSSFDRSGIIAVKCDPDRAIALRDKYDAITPAWHFNKRHWNDIDFRTLPDKIVRREILHSYLLVVKKNVRPKDLKEKILEAARSCGIGGEQNEEI